MDSETYQLLVTKLDDLHADIRSLTGTVTAHIIRDEQYYGEVYFIKRAFQATWTLAVTFIAGWLSWLGLRE